MSQQIREFYRLYKVNSFEEEIDYINKEFKTEQDAWNWLKNVERIKSRKGWRCEFVQAIPAVVGKSFTQIAKEAGLS